MSEVRQLKIVSVDSDRQLIERRIRSAIDGLMSSGTLPVGFAFVIWAEDGLSAADMGGNDKNRIPGILIPDFARNRLLAEKIEEWTMSNFAPPKPPGAA